MGKKEKPMEWNQTLAILISLFGLILWVLREMRADKAHIISLIEQDKKQIVFSIEKLSEKIDKESRDFHGRLCTIEEKYRQLEKK